MSLQWLNEEKIIQRLVEIVHPSQDEDRHSNASQSLCEIIRLSRDQMLQVQNSSEPDPLLATLEKKEIIEQLLSNIFHKEKNESAIVSAIQILLTLLETRRPTFEGHIEICPPGMSHSTYSVNKSVLEAIKVRLVSFHELLLEPPKKSVMKTTWGVLDPPVGNTRLNVIRLISSLLQTNTNSVNLELIELNSIGVILDMFFKYTWNNFLHTQVEICIALILASPFESTENGTISEQDSVGDNLLLKHSINPDCSLEGQILKLKLKYFGHLMRRKSSQCWGQLKSKGEEDEVAGWSHWCGGHGVWWTLGEEDVTKGTSDFICHTPTVGFHSGAHSILCSEPPSAQESAKVYPSPLFQGNTRILTVSDHPFCSQNPVFKETQSLDS
ncbi:Serine/threonine-protein phosphatase 6 regulatory subunit 3 [Varanus komodoensis]|nr:Serine/threonine-protein phosphatase 6 regulatory subunit 3 [Varanus komodoensis]